MWLVQLTNVVLHITDVEGGGRHGHPQALFLLSQDGLVEAVLLQVVHGQLTAAQLGHHVVGTAGDRPAQRTLRGRCHTFQLLSAILLKVSLTQAECVQGQCEGAT